MSSTKIASTACGLVVLLSACVPAHLQKYRKDGPERPAASSGGGTDNSLLHPQVDSAPPASAPARGKAVAANDSAASQQQGAAPRATIYAVDRQTYRFALREADVWDAALNVLMRNYNLVIVDRQSGIITTEWDSYFLAGAVYRNKVSLRVYRAAWNNIDVMVHNNVERLRDASQAAGTVGAVWLPSDDPANETARIVQNMALVLNQAPPVLPPAAGVARPQKGDQIPGTF